MTVTIGPSPDTSPGPDTSFGPGFGFTQQQQQNNKGYETRTIVGFGSLILDSPLVNSYPAGTTVQVYPATTATAATMSDTSGSRGLSRDNAQGPGPGPGISSYPLTLENNNSNSSSSMTLLPSFTGLTTFMGQGLGWLSRDTNIMDDAAALQRRRYPICNTTNFTSPNDVILLNAYQV